MARETFADGGRTSGWATLRGDSRSMPLNLKTSCQIEPLVVPIGYGRDDAGVSATGTIQANATTRKTPAAAAPAIRRLRHGHADPARNRTANAGAATSASNSLTLKASP